MQISYHFQLRDVAGYYRPAEGWCGRADNDNCSSRINGRFFDTVEGWLMYYFSTWCDQHGRRRMLCMNTHGVSRASQISGLDGDTEYTNLGIQAVNEAGRLSKRSTLIACLRTKPCTDLQTVQNEINRVRGLKHEQVFSFFYHKPCSMCQTACCGLHCQCSPASSYCVPCILLFLFRLVPGIVTLMFSQEAK